jgi:hypothetical protein
LLTVSALNPGHAARCPKTTACAFMGKALESLEVGVGFVLMLLMK